MVDLSTLHIRHSKRAKRLSMRANPKTQTIEVIVPPRTLNFTVERFVTKHADWIAERQKDFPQTIKITQGAIIPLEGIPHIIEIHRHTKRTTCIKKENNVITINTSRDDPTQNLKRWIIDYCKQSTEHIIKHKANIIGEHIHKIEFRDTTSRWGSCSSDRRIMLSWRLVMAPDYVLDYVIAHEVAHLKHMNHSKDFWNVCYSLTPKADQAKKWLHTQGKSLLAIF